jgi:hypothetical protein
LVELRIFISCGEEVEPFRDIAGRVLNALRSAFVFGLSRSVTVTYWDFRDASPAVVPAGQYSAPSLGQVDKSRAVIGILGASVPQVTGDELILATRRLAEGRIDQVWLFLDKTTKSDIHAKFIRRVRRATKMQHLYQEFEGELDFQEKLFVALTPYFVTKVILEDQTPVESAVGAAL